MDTAEPGTSADTEKPTTSSSMIVIISQLRCFLTFAIKISDN